jgi:hypothetical protein
MDIKLSRKWWLYIGATVGLLALVWMAGAAMAQGPGPEGEVQPQGEVSIAATVNSRISYQGVLSEGGIPVTGGRNMTFNFYTNDACAGAPVQSVAKNGVNVQDGLFSVSLDVAHGIFWGQGLWLEVEVGGTPIGCEEILPVPYALSLRPGAAVAAVVGDVASPSAVISAIQDDAGSAAFGVYGYAPTVGIYGLGVETGVKGHSYGHVGDRAGVYGESEMGAGVRGISAYNTGVYGESNAAYYDGGPFVNTNTNAGGQQVGVWAGSYWGNVIEGHEVDASGYSNDRVFRVTWQGHVYADGTYYCGQSINDFAGDLSEGEIAPCLVDDSEADFAEVMVATDGLEPGDVLVMAPDGKLARSTEAYQPTVVGVHSTRPSYVGSGHLLGQPGYAPLALVGVTPVKASAENGPIAPGDLLVASATPGHAMKADPNPPVGTVIGKALEALDEGTGVILVLVMLQ